MLLSNQSDHRDRVVRRSHAFTTAEIIEFVAAEYDVDPASYVGFRSHSPGRDVAALLCRELTCATLRELSKEFGLRHPDSSANLVRRAKRQMEDNKAFERQAKDLREKLVKTENQV